MNHMQHMHALVCVVQVERITGVVCLGGGGGGGGGGLAPPSGLCKPTKMCLQNHKQNSSQVRYCTRFDSDIDKT